MAIDVYLPRDIANMLRGKLIARYGNAIPGESEFLDALDSIGADVGLVRTIGGFWVDAKGLPGIEEGKE